MSTAMHACLAVLSGLALSAPATAQTNLFPGGDFATAADTAGWSVDVMAGAGTLSWQGSDDADQSATSGSLQFDTDAQGSQTAARSACFAVPRGGGASAGGMSRVVFVDGITLQDFYFNLDCEIHTSADCSGPAAGYLSPVPSTANTWTAMTTATGTLPADARSARCVLFLSNPFNAQPAEVRVDDLFFTADYVFHDGFE